MSTKLTPYLLSLFLVGCGSHSATQQSKLLQHETRVDSIIKQMTLEEKINMLHGKTLFSSAGVERLGIADMKYADGPFGVREELSPHSWQPLGITTDSATFFPTGSALAATWSEEVAYKYATGLARETRMRGKDMILGPAMNIQRIPTGGRTYEYLSEDPYLNARLAVGYTKGAQDHGAAVCLKHFALNNQENDRGSVDVIVDPRTMHEIYLYPFEAAVTEGDAYGVMSAYNKVNGKWCSENPMLLDTILRQQWGFAGMVISDWGGTHSTVGAVTSGLNVEMPGNRFMGAALLDSVRAGVVPESVIDQRVREILRVRLTVKPVPENEANKIVTAQPEQAQIAYEVASKSIVMLKNSRHALPLNLKSEPRIAVIGENATRTMALGGVGAGVKARHEVTPLEGLKDRIGNKATLTFVSGNNPKEAIEVLKTSDVVLFFTGNNREIESESRDRTSIELPEKDINLLNALTSFKFEGHIIAIVVSGAPLNLTPILQTEGPDAIVQSWFNGSEGGHALADILLGTIAPSGKLPFTYPVRLEDSPAYALKNYPQADEKGADVFVDLTNNQSRRRMRSPKAEYSEGMLVGYRWFDTKQVTPLYPFGHGLSYVDFTYSNLKVDTSAAKDTIRVSFDLANSGSMAAEEVAQLYISRKGSAMQWAANELKAFERVALKAGETKTVELKIPASRLAYWDETTRTWKNDHCQLSIKVGSSSRDIRLNGSTEI